VPSVPVSPFLRALRVASLTAWSALNALSVAPAHAGTQAFDGIWSSLDPTATAPSARREYAAVYDIQRDRYLIFGGWNQDGYYSYNLLNEIWVLTLGDTPTWSLLTPAVPGPGERHSPQWGYDPARQRLLIFGGYGHHYPGGDNEYLNDVWELSLDGTPTWTELTPGGTAPEGRLAGAAVYDPLRQRFVGFGGTSGLPVDTWELDLSGHPAWSTVDTDSTGPPGSYGMTMVYDPVRDRMLTFGGSTSDAYFGVHNDVWALDLESTPTWHKLSPGGALPSARRSGTAIYDPLRDRMVIYGGWDSGPSIEAFLGDAWAMSLSPDLTWSPLGPTGPTPSSRDAMQAVYDPVQDRMVVFGGWSGAALLNDTGFLSWNVPSSSATVSASVQTDSTVATVSWQLQNVTSKYTGVYRRQNGTPWTSIATAQRDGSGKVTYADHAVTPGARYGYMVAVASQRGEVFGGETWVTVASSTAVKPVAPAGLRLEPVAPNPVTGRFRVSFTLPGATTARVELVDLAGRRVLSREVGALGAGSHQLELGDASTFHPGMYFLRLAQGESSRMTRVVIGR
jgi:hypothetical protein